MNIAVAGFIEDARAAGHQLLPLSWSMAVPAAAVTDKAFETITGWLLEDLAGAGALDAVYLDLHGAMVAERFEDGEGEILRRVRDIVGPDMPVVVSLDLHANVTPAMIEHASALIAFRTYPHVDRADTGRRCARHLHGLLSVNGAPFKAYRQIPYIIPLAWQCTLVEPAVSIFKTLEDLEDGEAQSLSFTSGLSPRRHPRLRAGGVRLRPHPGGRRAGGGRPSRGGRGKRIGVHRDPPCPLRRGRPGDEADGRGHWPGDPCRYPGQPRRRRDRGHRGHP